jgi:hypothetical protein
MIARYCGPGGLATAPAKKDFSQRESYPTRRTEQTLTDLGQVYAVRILNAERALLCAGWRNHAGLDEAACNAGLLGEHFVDARHSYQFAYLCECAYWGCDPKPDEAIRFSRRCRDVYLNLDDLNDTLWVDDAYPSMLPMLAETVADNARDRQRAQASLREGVGILTAQLAFDFDIIVRPRGCGERSGPRD